MTEETKTIAKQERPKSDLAIKRDRLRGLVEKASPDLAQAIPAVASKYLTPERMTTLVMLAATKTPKLLECEPVSILKCVMECATIGLEPSGPLAHTHLIPRWNKKMGGYECTLLIGFQGYVELALRSGKVSTVFGELVYEKDEFERYNTHEGAMLHHRQYIPRPGEQDGRGEAVGAYIIAQFKDGSRHIEFMTRDDLEKVRDMHGAKDRKGKLVGPWVNDTGEMFRKTVVRRARKYWPQTPEMAIAAAIEDRETTDIDIIPKERLGLVSHATAALPPKAASTESLADMLEQKQEEPDEPMTPEERADMFQDEKQADDEALPFD